ncbi:protein Turandot X [Drosophila guanche]|uniref:Blast:Protein Turandot X n=1 Tax=Drosophila guanche TaxID=7266 RepID=A0A3B0KUX3_DROGU|nr:protein Turandot X [Drosophila guanche]SPP87748.1 blast:Protein Turandot X [Drosophila guanche]
MRVPLFLIVCLVCSANAQQHDARYEAEKIQILEIYNNPAVDAATRERNIPTLIDFYTHHSDRIQLPDEDRRQFDEFIGKYTESNSKLVDGVPAQGGWVGSLLSTTVGNLMAKLIFRLINQDTTTPKTI